ncbi:MAG: hypothetical protein IKW01_02735 [Firmicutes bacterium]|nr:hypothetical protein [Bacillota bacterium]
MKNLEADLYGSVITLKNLAIIQKERPLSADYIFQALMESSTALRPIYEEMLIMYRSGKDQEAFRIFAEKTRTKTCRNFAAILAKLDKINPSELVKQMEVFQNVMSEERMTAALRTAQRNSIIASTWAAAAIFALLINFAVVIIFLDALMMLENLF